MARQADSGHQRLIEDLHQYLTKKQLPSQQIKLIESFAKRYYASCSIEDLTKRSPEDLFGALISHWNLIYQRKPGVSKIRVFNPSVEDDGWQSTHTIIQVSNDDIPFLVDSIRMEANRLGLQVHYAIHFGGLKVKRDQQGRIVEILPEGVVDPAASSEAPIYFEIDRQPNADVMQKFAANLENILNDVKAAVTDWQKMADRVKEAIVELDKTPPPLDPAEIAESKDFLKWLSNNHFTFLGARDYKLIGNDTNRALQLIPAAAWVCCVMIRVTLLPKVMLIYRRKHAN